MKLIPSQHAGWYRHTSLYRTEMTSGDSHVVNQWNTLDYDTVNSKTVDEFKRRLDNEWKGLRYNYNQ